MNASHLTAEALGQLVARICDQRIRDHDQLRQSSNVRHLSLTWTSAITKLAPNGKRTISGIASTPTEDRVGDVVVPAGARYKTPIPLLWQHKHDQPIGSVHKVAISSRGIEIEASLVEGTRAADEAWMLISGRAINALSIGFIGIKGEPAERGIRWTSYDLIEISVVSCPANPDAVFQPKAHGGSVKLITPPRAPVRLIRG